MGIIFKENAQSWHASVRKPRKYFHLDHRPTLDVSLVGHAVPFQVSAAKFHKRKYINEDTTFPRHCWSMSNMMLMELSLLDYAFLHIENFQPFSPGSDQSTYTMDSNDISPEMALRAAQHRGPNEMQSIWRHSNQSPKKQIKWSLETITQKELLQNLPRTVCQGLALQCFNLTSTWDIFL